MPETNIQWAERAREQIIAREFTIAAPPSAAAVPYPPYPLPPCLPACPPENSRQARQAGRQTGLGTGPRGEEG